MSTLKNLLSRSLAVAALTALTTGMAHATAVFSTTATLTAADQVQSGRISRNNVPSDWSSQKVFPGLVAGTGLHYTTFDLDMSALQSGYSSYGQYIQISIDSVTTNTFLSAYLDSYNPANQALNYLGDPGTSGNYFGTDPLFYQVIVPAGHHLVLVFNETAANAGLGLAANILVEAFKDTEYSDLTRVAAVPEPASLQLALLALAGLAARRAVKKRDEKSVELLSA